LPNTAVAQRFSKPIPRSLYAIAEIAAALATGDSVGPVMPGILTAVASELEGTQSTLWLRARDGLRRAWSVGGDTTAARTVEHHLDTGDGTRTQGVVVARLISGGREIGAVSVRPGRTMASADLLFISTIADLLAPALRDAEYAQRLESEVAARTCEIEDQRRFIEKIIDSLPVGLYVIDREYRIQAWNRKRETGLQGVSREEAIGRTIFEILHRTPAETLRKEFESVFATGEIQQFSTESVVGGEARVFRMTKIPMRMEDGAPGNAGTGPITHVITIGEDITDSRRAEERFRQAEQLASLGTLAAGVMHEINNPLATIGACAENLSIQLANRDSELGVRGVGARTSGPSRLDSRALNPESRDALDVIQQEVYRCKAIIDDLLDFSRPRSREKSPISINGAIDRTLGLLKHHPRFRRLEVACELEECLPPVAANEEQIVQVFMALLLNALDAMDEKGVVTVRSRLDVAANMVVTEVVDRGVGIRSTDRSKIFEPFYTTKPANRGTGLGLSVCYAIVMEHGGRIEVDSVVGEGSVFRISLPAREKGVAE